MYVGTIGVFSAPKPTFGTVFNFHKRNKTHAHTMNFKGSPKAATTNAASDDEIKQEDPVREEEEDDEDDDSKEWQKLPIITFQTFDDLTGTHTDPRSRGGDEISPLVLDLKTNPITA